MSLFLFFLNINKKPERRIKVILDKWGVQANRAGYSLFEGMWEDLTFGLQLSHSGKKSVLELQDEVFSERPPPSRDTEVDFSCKRNPLLRGAAKLFQTSGLYKSPRFVSLVRGDLWWRRRASVVKSICCSSREAKFGSQYSQLIVTSAPGDPTPSSGVYGNLYISGTLTEIH